ncbi:MAG: EamA family transporter, partial [Pannonibacter phragmitetus]
MISRLNSRLNSHMTLFLTALAPAIWGSSYIVITEMLPPDRPLTLALLRALPAALLLLLIVRQLPRGRWIFRVLVLGALNFSIFWTLMNVGAYRLPGG